MRFLIILIFLSKSVYSQVEWPENIARINNTVETIFLVFENEFFLRNREGSRFSGFDNHKSLQFEEDHIVHMSISRQKSTNTLTESVHYFRNHVRIGYFSITKIGANPKETPKEDLFNYTFLNKESSILDEQFDILRFYFSWSNSGITISNSENERTAVMELGSNYTYAYFLESKFENVESSTHWWNCTSCSGKKITALARNVDENLWQFEYRSDPANARITGISFLKKQNSEYINHLLNSFKRVYTNLESVLFDD